MPGKAVVTAIRTLHINDQSTWRGGERQVLYLLTGLKERGHHAELVAQPGSVLGERAKAEGIPAYPIRMRGEADVFAAAKISRLIGREQVDIVHMHTAHAHTLGCLACVFNRRPICVVSRRVDFPINRKPFGLPALKYRWRVDHYIAISQAVKDILIAGGVNEDTVSIVHSGVGAPKVEGSREEFRRALGIAPEEKLVGTVGALVDHKGHRFLIEAAPQVLSKAPQTKFIMVGDGELMPSLRSLASKLNVDNAIMFAGFQPGIHKYIGAFDVFVAPSHMEGLNTSILDAMMLGRPVIGTTAGGIPEIIEHGKTGLLVPPKDPAALAEAIVTLVTEPGKAEKLALAGQGRVQQRFTADHMVEGTIAVYEKLLNERCKS
ncbi:MAG: glycosyltransferase family 1 protein [Candidatus Abyssobacteria bacterium SURF_17]|uniref:Glycosyltransferase family 1 protein n=1 Tax=Candidatus Abyssobacteria bacterium SURF_17 TaxID=2093361 RepID=A0A419EV38_9BACT|nr:MAG: glycosyltransferase family 1 protein [Candidatus Abyssubacteria bacterium SURF_17]